jgi:hypothetical protein
MQKILPHGCEICGCNLWYETLESAKQHNNYLYSKGKYFCRDCFINKRNKNRKKNK